MLVNTQWLRNFGKYLRKEEILLLMIVTIIFLIKKKAQNLQS